MLEQEKVKADRQVSEDLVQDLGARPRAARLYQARSTRAAKMANATKNVVKLV